MEAFLTDEQKNTVTIEFKATTRATYFTSKNAGLDIGGRNGSIAGRLFNQDTRQDCLLTCGHVLSWEGHSIVYLGVSKVKGYGTLNKVIWSNIIDAGVIDIDSSNSQVQNYKQIPPLFSMPQKWGLLKNEEVSIYVWRDRMPKVFKAKIIYVKHSFDFEHYGKWYSMRHLVGIKTDANDPKIKKGDSGALVTIWKGGNEYAIGIIVGGIKGEQLSFFLPMEKICNTLNLTIK